MRLAKSRLFWFCSQYGESASSEGAAAPRPHRAAALRYFFPLAENERRAEYYWRAARLLLREAGFPTEPRRIQAVAFRRGEETRYLQVGMEDGDSGEPVLLSFRAADSPYYWVCTPWHGLLGCAPIPVPDKEGTWAVDFGEEAAVDARVDRRTRRRHKPAPR